MSTLPRVTLVAQPLTRWRDPYLPRGQQWRRCAPRCVRRCQLCGRRRWARHLEIQVYYNLLRIFCVDQAACLRVRRARGRQR